MPSPKIVKIPNKFLKQYKDLVMSSYKRKADRALMREAIGRGHSGALATPEYRELLKGHGKEYLKEVAQDVSHPVDTFKRQIEMVGSKVTPTGEILKRSPADKAMTAGYLFALPLLSGVAMATDKEVDPTERAVKSIAYAIPPMLTPKVLPSFAASYIPDLMYPNKKKKKKRDYEKELSIQMKDIRKLLRAKHDMIGDWI